MYKPKNETNELLTFMCYSGYFSQKVILALIDALEVQSKDVQINKSISKKLYITFIELFQNIMKYSKKDYTNNQNSEKIVIKHNQESYFVTSINIINAESLQKVQTTLQEIVKLDKKEVTKRYNDLRKSGENTHLNGGGIGLYQIARKADAISYNIEKSDTNESTLTITVQINK